jgi:hypothetical protein
LAEIARNHNLRQFLTLAVKANPGSIDNSYVRIFGATLPIRRWEGRAEAAWIQNQPENILDYLPQAQRTLKRCAAVGILEEYAKSLAEFENVLGFSLDASIFEKVTDNFDQLSSGFEQALSREKLDQEVFEATDLLHELTCGDLVLYEEARARLKL